jgi:hypothetical protein
MFCIGILIHFRDEDISPNRMGIFAVPEEIIPEEDNRSLIPWNKVIIKMGQFCHPKSSLLSEYARMSTIPSSPVSFAADILPL